MIRLNVFLTLHTNETLQAGELIVADPDQQGRLNGQFRYHSTYLQQPAAFPLDPLHLPLSEKIFDASRPASGVHGVFEDSLPDSWGRTLMVRRYQLARDQQRAPNLLALLGGEGLGALAYSTQARVDRSAARGIGERNLAELQEQILVYEDNPEAVDSETALLFQAGSSPGGARPKALIKDKDCSYIAKFASIRDQFDMVALEAATMQLAKSCGVDTAATRCIRCGQRNVLLVKRFDIHPSGGFNHLVSMQTLLRADGYYNASYRDMAQVIRHISGAPAADLLKLFKQLVFHLLIGNTDDHLKNFCMLYNGNEYRLSPAFDILPNVGENREHVLFIHYSCLPPERATLLEEAKHFGIKRVRQAEDIIDFQLDGMKNWKVFFRESNVPESDIQRLEREISARMSKLQAT